MTDAVVETPNGATDDGAALTALLMSTAAGASTIIGALVVLLFRNTPGPSAMAYSLSLAGGVMLSVSVLELWLPQLRPSAKVDGPGFFEFLLSMSLGVCAFLLLSRLLPEPDLAAHCNVKDVEDVEMPEAEADRLAEVPSAADRRRWRLAAVMMLALTAHNFPEGLAVAVSRMESPRLGGVVMIAIAMHNIPEGIAIAVPVLDATQSRWKAVAMAALSGLAEPLGALVALTLLPKRWMVGHAMDNLLSFVGGVMSAVALGELLPEARAQKRPTAMVAGVLSGFLIMLVTHEYV